MSKEKEQPQHWETVTNSSRRETDNVTHVVMFGNNNDDYSQYPNTWSKFRAAIAAPAAEFLGVMILVIFGTGAICQVVLSQDPQVASYPHGDWLSLNFGWAAGGAMAVWICGGISGGHINPAVTLALAVWRGFSWKKVPGYIVAQVLGAWAGAAVVYGNYFHAIDIYEGGPGIRTLKTAGLFATYALPYMTNISAFFSEFLATATLVLMVLAVTDKRNALPAGLLPVAVFVIFLGIGTALGMETGYAINPARDLGARILTSMVGYGKEVYMFRSQYWLWCPIGATILGGQFGAAIYDSLIFTGQESIINKLNTNNPDRHTHPRRDDRDPKSPTGHLDIDIV